MNLKAPKTLAMLAATAAVLFLGGVLLTGCEETEAGKAETDSQTMQAESCSAKTANPACEATKEANPCPPECEKACCEAKKEAKTCPIMTGEANPSECPMKSHSKTKDAEAHSTEHNKPCSK